MDIPEVHAALRNEIIESQKTQAEFLKWKLIAVGAVSSISLGFTPVDKCANPRGVELLLCAIPLICAYIDFVSLHIMVRIVTIGTYLNKSGSEYERFVFLTREEKGNPFIFETAALHGSSFVFNLVLIGISFTKIVDSSVLKAYLWSGILGSLVAAFSWVFYDMKREKIMKLAKNN